MASALTHRSCKSHSHSELLSLICSEPPCRQLYLLLHNIDGPGAWSVGHTCIGFNVFLRTMQFALLQ